MNLTDFYKIIARNLPGGYTLPPIFIRFSITGKCNLNCPICSQRNSQELPFSDIKQIILNISQIYALLPFKPKIMLFGGEPTLHPDFCRIVDFLTYHKFRIGLTTNGTSCSHKMLTCINRSTLDEIIFSIDGDPSCHDQLRGQGMFNRTTETLHRIAALNNAHIKLRINTVLTASSKNPEEIIAIFKDIPVEHLFISTMIDDKNSLQIKDQCLSLEQFHAFKNAIKSKAITCNKKIVIRQSKNLRLLENPDDSLTCHSINQNFVINSKGEAGPCGRFIFLSLDDMKKSFSYNDKRIRNVRKRIRINNHADSCLDCCKLSKDIIIHQ